MVREIEKTLNCEEFIKSTKVNYIKIENEYKIVTNNNKWNGKQVLDRGGFISDIQHGSRICKSILSIYHTSLI